MCSRRFPKMFNKIDISSNIENVIRYQKKPRSTCFMNFKLQPKYRIHLMNEQRIAQNAMHTTKHENRNTVFLSFYTNQNEFSAGWYNTFNAF